MQVRSQFHNQAQLFDALGGYKSEHPLQIRVYIAGSREEVGLLASQQSPFPIKVFHYGDLSAGSFTYHTSDARFAGTIYFCPSRHENITYVISICSSVVWNRCVLRLMHALQPKVIPLYLSQSEMYSLLRQPKNIFPDSDVKVIAHSRKKRLKMGSRRKYESSRTSTDKPLEAVLAEAEEENFWFSSVDLHVHRAASPDKEHPHISTDISISKYGSFSCTSQFDRFFYGIIERMGEIGSQKLKFFSNRSRKVTRQHVVKPIAISYSSPVFTSQNQTNIFVNIMRKMSGTSCSVLHDNPYIHLSIVDNSDGSSADVWVVKEDEILLVPQLTASEVALKKVVNYIFEEWREGSLASPLSSDDLRPQET